MHNDVLMSHNIVELGPLMRMYPLQRVVIETTRILMNRAEIGKDKRSSHVKVIKRKNK